MRLSLVALVLLAAPPAHSQEKPEKVDLAAMHRIRVEAMQNGKVMDHLFYLTDVNGPRLTASPGFRTAADWSVKQLKAWGLANVHQEPWGTFGRSWSLRHFSAHMIEPTYAPLVGIPRAWSGGTSGPVTAEVVCAPLFQTWEDEDRNDLPKVVAKIEKYAAEQRGKLRGKIVMIDPLRELPPATRPAVDRYDAAELDSLSGAPEPFVRPDYEWPLTGLPADLKKRRQLMASLPMEVTSDYYLRMREARAKLNDFFHDEGVLAVLASDARGPGGIVFAEAAGLWRAGATVPPPVIVLEPEHYARMVRLLDKKIPVKVEVDVAVDFPDTVQDGVNVVAEIPGHGKKDEVVMVGAHLDSWHSGTGATDNAAGCAVGLEAVRILKTLDLPMERTVRLALWSGEEQGLLGSRGYVRAHFGDPVTMALKPEHAKLAGYFNLDNGSGKIRGVYLQGNDMVRPIFESWLAPFRDLGATKFTIRNTGGTDHLSFDAVGLPGFQFIQDPLDYSTRTHHSNLDVYDHVQPGDLMQAAAIVASFVYDAATSAKMLPRKPLPKPLPPKKEPEAVAAGR
jgi:carboxypeptidase Q